MFPRNVRKIEPWKVAQYLSIFEGIRGDTWAGNQKVQNFFRKNLVDKGIVRDASPYDPHSGGPRTYEAQLRSLGLIYRSDRKTIELTLAGESICNSEPPLAVLQRQLLNQQYPSPYGAGPQVRIHPGLRVKPLLFILNLLKRPEILSLTADEMIIPVIYGHNHGCESLCAEKILRYRAGATIESLLDNPKEDLHTPRTAGNSIASRLKDVFDIANTCKNYLESCLLISPVLRGSITAYQFNPDAEEEYTHALNEQDKFVPNPEIEVSFQRAYGSWGRAKDIRHAPAATPKRNVEASFIQAHFFEYCGTHVVTGMTDELIDYIYRAMGIPKDKIRTVVETLLPRSLDLFESRYLELSVGGAPLATEFEQATCNLFVSGLGLEAEWVGSKRKSRAEKGAFTDIVFYSPDRAECGIADTKATAYYNLPSTDYAKMISNYLPNYKTVAREGSTLRQCTYVAGGFTDSFDAEAGKLHAAAGIPCSGIRAKDLLSLSQKKNPPKTNWDLFSRNGRVRL